MGYLEPSEHESNNRHSESFRGRTNSSIPKVTTSNICYGTANTRGMFVSSFERMAAIVQKNDIMMSITAERV